MVDELEILTEDELNILFEIDIDAYLVYVYFKEKNNYYCIDELYADSDIIKELLKQKKKMKRLQVML